MDNIAGLLTATLMQDIGYIHVAMAAIMIYDWLILFESETKRVWFWERGWGLGSALYVISRYGLFFDMPINIILHTAPYGAVDYDTCGALYKIAVWSTFIGISISETILLLRTSALYHNAKWVCVPLFIGYAIVVVTGIVITQLYLRTVIFGPPPSDLIAGCFIVKRSQMVFFDYLMLLIVELVVVILTVWKGYQEFYSGSSLFQILFRDSIGFFLVLFALTFANILALAFAPLPYSGFVSGAVRAIHSLVCCRIILHAREAAEDPDGTSESISTPGLVFASVATPQRTDPTETIEFDTYCNYGATRNDEECLRVRRRTDPEFVEGRSTD